MSKVYLACDAAGFDLKEALKPVITDAGDEVVDLTGEPAADFLVATEAACQALQHDEQGVAIVIDAYGVGSYMAANKYKGIIPANLSEERTAYMTKQHNNARMITLGSEIVGTELAKNITKEFLKATYDGGRHQIRVDMMYALDEGGHC